MACHIEGTQECQSTQVPMTARGVVRLGQDSPKAVIMMLFTLSSRLIGNMEHHGDAIGDECNGFPDKSAGRVLTLTTELMPVRHEGLWIKWQGHCPSVTRVSIHTDLHDVQRRCGEGLIRKA